MVSLYHGSNKIRDRSEFGVYCGNQPIYSIFKGSQLVYQYHPFEPEEALVNQTSGTKTITIPRGLYYLEVVGGGGWGNSGDAGYTTGSAGGGSGARFSANISIYDDITLVFSCGEAGSGSSVNGGVSTLTINGTTVCTCGGGVYGNPYYQTGVGGTVTSNTSISGVAFSNVTNRNGNDGARSDNTTWGWVAQGGASVASTGTYGQGASSSRSAGASGSVSGWIYLKYVGAN